MANSDRRKSILASKRNPKCAKVSGIASDGHSNTRRKGWRTLDRIFSANGLPFLNSISCYCGTPVTAYPVVLGSLLLRACVTPFLSFFLVCHSSCSCRCHSTLAPSELLTPMHALLPSLPLRSRARFFYDERGIIAGKIGVRCEETLKDEESTSTSLSSSPPNT